MMADQGDDMAESVTPLHESFSAAKLARRTAASIQDNFAISRRMSRNKATGETTYGPPQRIPMDTIPREEF